MNNKQQPPLPTLQSAIGQAEQALSLGGIGQAMFATPEPVYQICKADSVSISTAWIDVQKQQYDDAALYPEYGRRVLYAHPAPSVPATSGPMVWNSIQIASWIGSQLMHEPSVFDRSAVCKFVRSLGRHPTLLKHSPSTHSPSAPGVPDDVVRDAIATVREQYRGTDLGKAAEGSGDAIDAAMLAASPAQKGPDHGGI